MTYDGGLAARIGRDSRVRFVLRLSSFNSLRIATKLWKNLSAGERPGAALIMQQSKRLFFDISVG